jgi:nicotinamide riboside kinase
MTTVINLWAAPGSGKSTLAAGLFYRLKCVHADVELTTEYAKDLVHSNRMQDLEDQVYVFGKQQHKIQRLAKQYKIIITDSPVLMGLVYATEYPQCFRETVAWRFNQFNNMNFLVHRNAPYQKKGRNQTEIEAQAVHERIVNLMHEFSVPYSEISGSDAGLDALEKIVRERLSI